MHRLASRSIWNRHTRLTLSSQRALWCTLQLCMAKKKKKLDFINLFFIKILNFLSCRISFQSIPFSPSLSLCSVLHFFCLYMAMLLLQLELATAFDRKSTTAIIIKTYIPEHYHFNEIKRYIFIHALHFFCCTHHTISGLICTNWIFLQFDFFLLENSFFPFPLSTFFSRRLHLIDKFMSLARSYLFFSSAFPRVYLDKCRDLLVRMTKYFIQFCLLAGDFNKYKKNF